jgi:hypothetical protein
MPVEQIQNISEVVEHPVHRAHLETRLGVLAHAGMLEPVEPDLTWTEGPRDHVEYGAETLKVSEQARITTLFFKDASAELGPDASEDQIWDKVFEYQLEHLKPYEENTDTSLSVATNVLVNNLLSVHGLPKEEAARKLDDRMWRLAKRGVGMSALAMANMNKDLCVVSGDPETPYRSVIEQTQGYESLFTVTEASERPRSVAAMPVEALSDTGIDNKGWFFGRAATTRNYSLVEANRKYIGDDEAVAVAKEAARYHSGPVETFRDAGLAPISDFEYADALVSSGRNVDKRVIAAIEGSEQRTLFAKMAETYSESALTNALYGESFNDLDAASLDLLLAKGVENKYVPLSAFKDLPAGTYTKVAEAGWNKEQIVKALDGFAVEDRKQAFDDLMNSQFDAYLVFANPDKFDFIPKNELLEQAREKGQLWTAARNIDKWTDGSDQEMLQYIIEQGYGAGDALAENMDKLPALDKEWLVGEFRKKDDLGALAESLPHVDTIDQEALLDEILADEGKVYLMRYKLPKFDKLDPAETLDKLIAAGGFETVAGNVPYFTDETYKTIEKRLASYPDGLVAIAHNISMFKDTDRKWLADALIDADRKGTAANIADALVDGGVEPEWFYNRIKDDPEALDKICGVFSGTKLLSTIGTERVFADFLATKSSDALARNMSTFNTPEMQTAIIGLCIEQRDSGNLVYLAGNSSLTLDRMDVVQKCMAAGWEQPLIRSWEKVFLEEGKAQFQPTAEQLLSWGGAGVLLAHLDRYPGTPVDAAMDMVLQRKDDNLLIEVIARMKGVKVSDEVAYRLLESDYIWAIDAKKELFNPGAFNEKFWEKYMTSGHDEFAALYEYSGQRISWMDRGLKGLGTEASAAAVLAAREIDRETDEPLPQEIADLGVTRRGNVGVDQLRAASDGLRQQLIGSSENPAELEAFVALTTTNALAGSMVKKLVRFNTSQWGSHGDEEWQNVLRSHLDTRADQEPLREGMVVSSEYTVRKIDAKEFDPTVVDKDAKELFALYQEDLEAAFEVAESPANGRYDRLFIQGQTILRDELSRLQRSREQFIDKGNNMAVLGVEKRIKSVEDIADMSGVEFVRTFQNDFTRLASLKLKPLDRVLRTGVFARALQKSSNAQVIGQKLRAAEVDHESLQDMSNFVEQIVNDEVYGNYFKNDKARKSFVNMSDTKSFNKQIMKLQAGKSSGETRLQFIPSRGLPLELSGHIADACWASKYESIAKEFPNVTAITMVRNPGTRTERLVGAGLAIDTTDQDTGEPVMVLRGLNPIENYINGMKVEDFMGAYLDYAKSIAGGRKIAIAIDETSGAAASNRPVIITYLNEKVKQDMVGQPVRVGADSTFNGYELTPARHPAYQLNG